MTLHGGVKNSTPESSQNKAQTVKDEWEDKKKERERERTSRRRNIDSIIKIKQKLYLC